jgi:hypothetical protein
MPKYTQEELDNNYTFKIIQKSLKQEFPFIKKVYLRKPKGLDLWSNNIFVDVDINPYEISERYGLPLDGLTERYLRRGQEYWSPHLSMFFKLYTIEERRIIGNIVNDTNYLIHSIQENAAIPNHLKFFKKVNIGAWYANPDTVPHDIVSGGEGI